MFVCARLRVRFGCNNRAALYCHNLGLVDACRSALLQHIDGEHRHSMDVFRTADNLWQIASLEATHPVLAVKVKSSIKLLLREPKTIPPRAYISIEHWCSESNPVSINKIYIFLFC